MAAKHERYGKHVCCNPKCHKTATAGNRYCRNCGQWILSKGRRENWREPDRTAYDEPPPGVGSEEELT